MSRCVAFDLSRLFIGSVSPTPRGIDRVDLAYARHFLEAWGGDCIGTLPTPWGIRWYNRQRSLLVVDYVEKHWRENESIAADRIYATVKAQLRGETPAVLPKKDTRSDIHRLLVGMLGFVREHGIRFGAPILSLPRGAVYLNVGQHALAVPSLLTWLTRREDVKPVFMMQDVIPVEFPEYCSVNLVRGLRQMLATVARYAAGLLLTTKAAEQSIRRELAALGRTEIETITELLPVPSLFLTSTPPAPELAGITYFVVCGAIEPRKNVALLLNVWRELVHRRGPKTPKLVVVGSRSPDSKEVLEMLDRCKVIRGHVIEIGGLSSPSLRQLVAGARALLMPSFAEGFGLPIIEALTLGTPVVASNLACHKEVGGSLVQYLSPIDGSGWLEAVEALTYGNAAQTQRALAKSYRPQTWSSYFETIAPFVLAEKRQMIQK
jgi:glycosyltransferase involved in cell wall biosynthesis